MSTLILLLFLLVSLALMIHGKETCSNTVAIIGIIVFVIGFIVSLGVFTDEIIDEINKRVGR